MTETKTGLRWIKRWSHEPVWRYGVMEIRDVKKNGGEFARNGYDDMARYNLWINAGPNASIFPAEISTSLTALKRWAEQNYDRLTEETKA